MAAVELSDSVSEQFEVLGSWKVEDIIPVYRFRSRKTGLTVCLAQVDGPVVNGYFCLATEAEDDDGLPHTLEHLIFLGSELYPYKGVLDLVANRCLASGTNAWTDTDHTCYTVVNAGANGFLQILPIYLDHILYPVLSDAAFTTEVHHVNGDGDDAGVVYCEMQGCENTGERLVHHAMLGEMYPEPSGYRCETGGIMKNLRESTTNEKVRSYHSAFYRPENLCVIVAGQVEVNDLLSALLPVEEKILSKESKPPFQRPWQTPVPQVNEDVEKKIFYPSDDVTNGIILAAWRGPHCTELERTVALSLLADYLTDTAISPLQKEFVECDDPYCTKVAYSCIENLETCVYFHFQDVVVDKLDLIKDKLQTILSDIANGTESFDMKRMKTICRRKMLSLLSTLESNPHDVIAQHLIGDFLYGEGGKDLEVRLNEATMLRSLIEKSERYWLDLLTSTFIDNKMVFIKGEPSKQLMEKMAEEEKSRVASQREALGETGLKDREQELQKATEENEKPPPDEMISGVPVPSVANINFLSIKRSDNHFPERAEGSSPFSLEGLPVCFLLDNAKTNFVQLCALLNTNDLDNESRLYLPLLAEVLLELPILRDGELVPHEKVILQLSEDTVKSSAMLGIGMSDHTPRFSCGVFAQVFNVNLKVELKRYVKAVAWLKELLFQTRFTVDRLKVIASKIINSVANHKQDGSAVSHSMIKDICFGPGSNHYANNIMRQHTFLSSLIKRLEESPQEIIDKMTSLRDTLTRPGNITIYMAADVERLVQMETNPEEPWMSLLPNKELVNPHDQCFSSVKKCHSLLNASQQCPVIGGIVGVGSVESAFMVQAIPAITSHTDVSLPAVLVLLQYLTQLEGPMWRQIRGLGLAYSYNMTSRPDDGLLILTLYRCSQIVAAYKEAKEILRNHIEKKESWDDALLESAKSSLLFEIIEQEKSVVDVCYQSLLSYFRGIPQNFNRELIEKISAVTSDDLDEVGSKIVLPVVDGALARCAVCCHPSKVEEVAAGFKELSRELQTLSSLESSFLSRV